MPEYRIDNGLRSICCSPKKIIFVDQTTKAKPQMKDQIKDQMAQIEDLWDNVRATKLQLIRSTRFLLLALEEADTNQPGDWELEHQIAVVSRRFESLQEEMVDDLAFIKKEVKSGYSILEKALKEMKMQLEKEMRIFDTEGNNADRLLDLNFRIQEIENSIGRH